MYREVRPNPATSQSYVTKGPEDNYQAKTPQSFAQYAQRAPLASGGAYVIRDGPQYQARQPTKLDHVMKTPASLSEGNSIEYAVRTPMDFMPREDVKSHPKRMAYVESVSNSDEDSDDKDHELQKRLSASAAKAAEYQSSTAPPAPLTTKVEDAYTPLHRYASAPAETSTKSRRPASISIPSHNARPSVSPLQYHNTRHHSMQLGSNVLGAEYAAGMSTSPTIRQLTLEHGQPPSPQSPYSGNTYREVQPVERRRSSSHRQSIGAQSPRSPYAVQYSASPARSASYGFGQALVETQESDQPRKLSSLAEEGPKSPKMEKRRSSPGLGIQFVEVKPPESLQRGLSVSEKRSKPLAITNVSNDSSSPTSNQFLVASNSGSKSRRRESSSARPPPSPLLEAYKGTYQSISPMPSPIMAPAIAEPLDDLPPLSPSISTTTSEASSRLSRSRSKSSSSKSKHAKIYDAPADADLLLSALSHHSGAKSGPFIAILPHLSHDQLLELKGEYKRRYRVAGHGVNLAKHIKTKTSGNFGKACYVVALGRWESEAYWANFWYQSNAAGRELLIESLMGRSNAEIRAIKDGFRDKRYNDSLIRCMEKELKADKFRKAILMALEEKKQEETDVLSLEARHHDIEALNKAILSKDSGESAIISIIIGRSDTHLREVLKAYEVTYNLNFAKEALKKSNNLVGELLAHVLNGVINRPVRDAMLLHHAIVDVSTHNSAIQLRHELLISRLVRLHWDRTHLIRVREEYAKRYGGGFPSALELEVAKACKGEYGDFCVRLCEV